MEHDGFLEDETLDKSVIKIKNLHNQWAQRLKTELNRILGKNLLERLLKLVCKLAKSVIEIKTKL